MKKVLSLFHKAVYKYLYEIRLQSKLLLAFCAMSLVLLLSSSLLVMWYVSSVVEKQLLNSATETFDQTTTSLQYTFSIYDQISTGLATSYLFDNLMKQDMENYTPNQISTARQDFERFIFASIRDHVSSTSHKVALKIYFNDGFHYFNNRTRYYALEDHLTEPWVTAVLEQYSANRGGFYIIPGNLLSLSPEESPACFSMVRVVMDKNYYSHILALMRIDISSEYLNDMITTTAFPHTFSAVVNQDSDVLAFSDADAKESLYPSLIAGYDLWELPAGSWNTIVLNQEKYLIRTVSLPDYHLLHFSLIPRKSLYNELRELRISLILIVFLIFLLCIPFVRHISHALVFRLQSVVDTMGQVKEGKLATFQEGIPHGTDEVGELISSYNHMIEQMKLLIQREYAHGAEIKNAELKTLQAQINPHFLYNSLDMIYWFARENMVKEIEKSVSALATFYRIGLSNGKEIITLREEIDHTQAYMKLWNLRLQDTITYECQVDEELMDCLIIKSILQPILENSVSHGIREKDVPVGMIRLHVHRKENDIELVIQDDGIGIDQQTLEKLNSDTLVSESAKHGYGIHNVRSRLQLYYGSSCCLKYQSSPGQGTMVIIRIPVKTSP